MQANFSIARNLENVAIPHGTVKTLVNPAISGSRQLVVLDVILAGGKGHSFHRHPGQEEVIYVVEGRIEQWVEKERMILEAGDSAFIPSGQVHASFTLDNREARILAIFGPCIGEGFTTEDVFDQAPWKDLR